jgi:hypothetical protein
MLLSYAIFNDRQSSWLVALLCNGVVQKKIAQKQCTDPMNFPLHAPAP